MKWISEKIGKIWARLQVVDKWVKSKNAACKVGR